MNTTQKIIMQTVTTKILPATYTKPSRIKATTYEGESFTLSWREAENLAGQEADTATIHYEAVKGLLAKLGQANNGEIVAIDTPNGFIFSDYYYSFI